MIRKLLVFDVSPLVSRVNYPKFNQSLCSFQNSNFGVAFLCDGDVALKHSKLFFSHISECCAFDGKEGEKRMKGVDSYWCRVECSIDLCGGNWLGILRALTIAYFFDILDELLVLFC